MEQKIEATSIFFKNMEAQSQIIVNRGGARSSKSYSIAQKYTHSLLMGREQKLLVVRKALPSLKLSTLKTFKHLFYKWGVHNRVQEAKVSLDYTFKDNWLHFGSVDDPEKIKSTEWTQIWMEEANEFTYEDFIQLKLRLSAANKDGRNQLTMSLNPADMFSWVKTKVVDASSEDVIEIQSTYKDNPYLDADYISILNRLEEQDPNLHRIYALGEWGKLDNLIYPNWVSVDTIPFGKDETIYGLDFGFNNPTALMRISMVDGVPYEQELLYRTGLTNSQLIDRLKILIPDRKKYLYADCAEPQRIQEIKQAGFNIHPANKAVNKGIDFVQSFPKICIVKTSENLIKEKRSYSWKTDKDGTVYDEPVEYNDHLIDAERYALYTHFKQRQEFKVRWL